MPEPHSHNGKVNGKELLHVPPKRNGVTSGWLPEGHTLTAYLREIGQIPLLTREEEQKLAKLNAKGNKPARDQLIKSNLRFVVKIAHDYKDRGLPFLDLISEGNIGLVEGLKRFKPNKGTKVSTYTSWWIKQHMSRAIDNQSRTIRLPIHMREKLSKIRKAIKQLENDLNREPTHEEISAELGIKKDTLEEYLSFGVSPVSIHAPISSDGESLLEDIIPDPDMENASDIIERDARHDMLRRLVKTLPENQAKILRLRFGLDGGTRQTLEEVGKKFGVTRERIRQIEVIAIKKLNQKIMLKEKIWV